MPKYKYTLDPVTRNFIELQIQRYPENVKQLEELRAAHMPRIIASYDNQGKGSPAGGAYRPTEAAALRLATSQYILQLELSISAIRGVYERLSPEDQELIRLRYWSKGQFNPDGVALKLYASKTTMYSRINLILTEIGYCLGYVNLFE